MVVELNHTIVNAKDKRASATFFAEMLGLPEPTTYGPFFIVEAGNHVELAFLDAERVHPQHYAFLVSDEEFDQVHARILERGLDWWADPYQQRPGEWNTDDGGRGLYWQDPDGHMLEIITVPYGGPTNR
jgi:catechol 2,3-dioxygenase-like lactoylglutathione lyase family enzyme